MSTSEPVIRPTEPSNRLLANIVHALLHILDDSEENAQTGVVSLEISKDDWAELNRVIDLISDDPHETLHELIGVNDEPPDPDGECFRGGEAADALAEEQARIQRELKR